MKNGRGESVFNRRPRTDELLFLPLGGTGEIGMNLNLYGHAGKWLMVDLGMTFADAGLPGIDLILPDPVFVEEHLEDLEALVLTHGHEDHIGAVPHLWDRFRCPIYATPFTAELVRRKLDEAGLGGQARIIILPLGSRVTIGPFDCEFVTLTHSIPEPNALILRTRLGTVVHTGDWKLDPDPLVGTVADRARLEEIGREGVLAMVCDSTNVFSPGTSGSEADVRRSLVEVVAGLKGKVAVTTFASNVARIASVAHAAAAADRHLVLVGRSMHRVTQVARDTGYIQDLPPVLDEDEAGYLPADKVLYLCTGSQGEPRGAMARIARGEHRHVTLGPGDTAVFSSKIIPGNEVPLGELHNRLVMSGVRVITEKNAPIHVSGHPNRDELAAFYGWARPRISVPVHGEARHLAEHAAFARSLGIEQAPVLENGVVLRLAPEGPKVLGRVEVGRLAVDGPAVVPVDSPAITQRRKIAFAGQVVVTLVVDGKGRLKIAPQVLLSGISADAEDDLEEEVAEAVRTAVASLRGRGGPDALEEPARQAARRAVNRATGKKPLTLVQVIAVP